MHIQRHTYVCTIFHYTLIHTHIYTHTQDDNNIQVVGIKEFPYTCGGELEGAERLIERELWFKDDAVPSEGCEYAPYVIVHVHFGGRWHDDESKRDWYVCMYVYMCMCGYIHI
jgi:hypothetical protein